MFKRVLYEDWNTLITMSALVFFLVVFLFILARCLWMKKDKVDHMSHLPLEEEKSNRSVYDKSTPPT